MLDPDGSAHGLYKGIGDRRWTCQEPEPNYWTMGFKLGNRREAFDLVFNLHNIQGGQVDWKLFP